MMSTGRIAQAAAGTKSDRARALAAVWFAVAVWGASFVAARSLLSAGTAHATTLSPAVLAATRFSMASLVFVVPLARAIARREVSGRDLLLMALLGQLSFSFYFWLQYTGVQRTNAGIASILVIGLTPIATLVFSQRLGQERAKPRTVAMLLLGFVGVALIVLHRGILVAPDPGFLFGALCLISNAFAFAAYVTLNKRWMRGIPPVVVTGGTMVSGAIGLLLISLLDTAHNRWGDLARLNIGQWTALLYLAVVCSVGGFFAYNFALTKLPASRATLYLYCEPVVAVVLGVALLGETMGWQTVLGVAAIAVSVALASASGV